MKSQIEALDRSQPMLPMRPGQIERRTHNYTRHSTTSLFAALDIATGPVIGRLYPKHRSTEFRKLLDQIDVRLIWCGNDHVMQPGLRPWIPKQPLESFNARLNLTP